MLDRSNSNHNNNKQLVKLYLNHLKLPEKSPSPEYLAELQKRHIETIPHENIDGIYNIHSSFEMPYLLNKYIVDNRGGMCFELNYSFAWLLHQLGFKVEIILANVLAYDYKKEKNKYPTHPIIIVHFNDAKFLTDVGWSDSYKHPLALTSEEYKDSTGTYRVANTLDDKLAMQKLLKSQQSTDEWHDQFVFAKPQCPLKEFTYPKGFLASHAYTHVGKGYLFTNLFHFTKVSSNGHSTIWGDRLLARDNKTKSDEKLTKKVAVALRDDFKVAPDVAKKCVRHKRSTSQLFSYKPVTEDELIDRTQRKSQVAP